jgi:YD repeat-containing protein
MRLGAAAGARAWARFQRAIWRGGPGSVWVFGVIAGLLLFTDLAPLAQSPSVVYEHDTQGRLKKATYGDGTIINYSYDASGNRTAATVLHLPPDTTLPSAPGAPVINSITSTSAVATWTEATDNVRVVAYERRLGSGAWQTQWTARSVSLVGLSGGTTYTFQVRARDAAGNVSPVSSTTFTTLDLIAPSVPTGLTASAPTSNSVNLAWTASTDNVAVVGYKVFRNGTHIVTRTSTGYTDNSVSGGVAYSYRVSAHDAAGNNSAQSNAATLTPPDTIAPSTPSNLSASATGSNRVALSWSGSSDTGGSGLAGYRIYRNGIHIVSTSSTSHSDTTAAASTASTAYSYTVVAYDGASNVSAQSNTASVTTPPPLLANVNKTAWSWMWTDGSPLPNPTPVVVTASGGLGGYSYSWQWVSGDTQTTVLKQTSNSTGWTRNVTDWNVFYNSVWRCVVTDSGGNTVQTVAIAVSFRKNSLD